MLIPDSMAWILGTWAKEINKWNSDTYDFVIFPTGEILENERLFLSTLHEVDIVHCLTQWGFPKVKAKIDSAGDPHVALISTIHHIFEFSQVESCLQAEKIMVVCQTYMDELLRKGVPSEKLTLIYNGVDTDLFSARNMHESKAKFHIPPEAFTVGFSAKASSDHDERKGVDTFLEVLAKLSQLRSDVHVIVTGPGWEDKIQDRVSSDVHMHYFSFLPAKQMPDFYNALDAYVVAARVEGGPVPLLEAMSCGTPVVTTPVGTALDFVKDRVNGLMLPMGDADGIVRALHELHADDALRQKLASAGRETILHNLQWKNTVARMDRLYGDVIERQGHTRRGEGTQCSFSELNARLIRKDMKRWNRYVDPKPKWYHKYRHVYRPLIRLSRAVRR
jgi:glycosyltransferase involved in cell wall biosynthesis